MIFPDSSTLAVAVDAHRLPTRTVGILDGMGPAAGAQGCFVEVAERLMARHGDIVLIMVCTEIPLALPSAPQAVFLRQAPCAAESIPISPSRHGAP